MAEAEEGTDTDNIANDNLPSKEGQAKHRLHRSVKREDRISVLTSTPTPTTAEEKELAGLMKSGLKYEEQYCPDDFTAEHTAWKRDHNAVFTCLDRYCGGGGRGGDEGNLFYLDGPDAGTTSALTQAGVDAGRCYVANRHSNTCERLRGYLPPQSVVHASAEDALAARGDGDESDLPLGSGAFATVPFRAYYFDGCGGYAPIIVAMMKAAFGERRLVPPVAVGFSLVGGGRDVVDKEQGIVRSLVGMVKPLGMRVDHVLDDPDRYGIPKDVGRRLRKVDGGVMTTWYMIEEGR